MIPVPVEVSTELATDVVNTAAWRGAKQTATAEQIAADPEYYVTAWTMLAALMLELPRVPWAEALGMLHELRAAGEPVMAAELATRVRTVARAGTPAEPAVKPPAGKPTCKDCGYVHDLSPFNERNRIVPGGTRLSSVSSILFELGAVAYAEDGPHGLIWLTPLGAMLAESIFAGCAIATDADAAALVEAVKQVPPMMSKTLMKPWLEARSPADATRELFDFAETCPDTNEGQAAVTLAASAVGPDGIEAWRELAAKPGFGVYGRAWLSHVGEPWPERPEDKAWLAVDSLKRAMLLDADGFADRVRLIADRASLAIDVLVDGMARCGHQGAPRVIEQIKKITG